LAAEIALSLALYPGLAFTVALSLISQWFRRKIVARLQSRVGPKFVGPLGVLQPFADVYKLLTKEVVAHPKMRVNLLAFAGLLGLTALSSAMLLTPLCPLRIGADYDVFVFIYLSAYATIALSLAGLASSSPYPSIGGSRYLALATLFEPAFAISLVSLVELLAPGTFSLSAALRGGFANRGGGPLGSLAWAASFAMGAAALWASLLAKLSMKPFDISEAETEIAGGLFAELSGPLLAIYVLLHEAEVALTFYVFANLLLPFAPGGYWAGLGLSLLKYFAVLGATAAISYSYGRLKLGQALRLLAMVSLPLAIVSLVLALRV